jgi:hypothetical protein
MRKFVHLPKTMLPTCSMARRDPAKRAVLPLPFDTAALEFTGYVVGCF